METQDQDQLWACLTCKTVRAWGAGEPHDAACLPLLRCESCGKPQRFAYVAEEVSAA
jgi:hypothetical protein